MVWLTANLSEETQKTKEFAFALMSSVMQAIFQKTNHSKKGEEKEKELLLAYVTVLYRFLEGAPVLQIEAIYAIQTHWHKHACPTGLFLRYLRHLYGKVFTEEALNQWKASSDHKYPAKKQALEDSDAFFQWLINAQEESG